MAVPETPMYEDYLSVPSQHNIRISGQLTTMNPKPISHSMNKGAN